MQYWRRCRSDEFERFVGPLEIWSEMLVQCPMLFLLLGLAIPGALGFLGVQAAAYAPKVDLDFAGYLAVDLPVQFTQNAVEEWCPFAGDSVCENPWCPEEAIAQETSQTQRSDDWAGRLF